MACWKKDEKRPLHLGFSFVRGLREKSIRSSPQLDKGLTLLVGNFNYFALRIFQSTIHILQLLSIRSKFSTHIIIAFALLLIFESGVRSIQNDYTEKARLFSQSCDSIETLILGSSVAFRGINPILINENTFNYAFQGQSHDVDQSILETLHKELPRLNEVLIPVSTHSMKNHLSNSVDPQRASHYSLFTEFNVSSSWRNQLAFTNFVYYRDRLLEYLRKPSRFISIDNYGYSPLSAESRTTEFSNIELEIKLKNWQEKTKLPSNKGKESLLTIAEFCRKKNIKLILIETPYSPSFELAAEEVFAADAMRIARIMSKDFPNVFFIQVPEALFEDSDFADPTHLNSTGAKKWSNLIQENL